MIEFKGAFFKNRTMPSQAVLVQFDGVLLHIWHMSNPFHRILSSDIFDLTSAIGSKSRYIKLPNGGRIETDDIQALTLLQSNCRPWLANKVQGVLPQSHAVPLIVGLIVSLIAVLVLLWLFGA